MVHALESYSWHRCAAGVVSSLSLRGRALRAEVRAGCVRYSMDVYLPVIKLYDAEIWKPKEECVLAQCLAPHPHDSWMGVDFPSQLRPGQECCRTSPAGKSATPT